MAIIMTEDTAIQINPNGSNVEMTLASGDTLITATFSRDVFNQFVVACSRTLNDISPKVEMFDPDLVDLPLGGDLCS